MRGLPAFARRAADALRPQATPGIAGRFARHARPLAVFGTLVLAFYVPMLATGTVQYDGLDVHYSSQRYFSDAIRSAHLPFWTPDLFGGFPFLADPQVGAWYPFNWPFFLFGVTPRDIGGELLMHTLIAGAGAYALAVRLTGQSIAGLGAAVFYALSGYFAAHSQHVGIFETTAWLPWLMLALDLVAERLTVRRLAVAGLVGAMLALPGHFQTALYAFSGAGLWAVLEVGLGRSMGRLRRVAAAVLASGVWGGLLAAVMILPAAELVSQSVRTRLSARSIDLGYFQPDSLLTLVQPDHFGLLSGAYIGPGDVTQHYFYAGVLLVPLVLIGASRARVLRAALCIGLPFVWYALGPAAGMFRLLARLPGFASVELPMHGWFLPALGLALLGGSGLDVLQRHVRWQWLAPLVLFVTWVDVLVFNQLLNPLAFGRQPIEAVYGAAQRALLTQVEAAEPPVRRLYGPPLASVGYRNHALQDHVATTYGYNPLELAAYADYADAAEGHPPLERGLAATHRLQDGALLVDPGATSEVFFARHLTVVPDTDSARSALAELDPAQQTLVELEPSTQSSLEVALAAAQLDPAATVEVVARQDDRLDLRYRTAAPNLLRVAIPWYPGWHATLNGADLPLLRVDAAFVGILVPPGEGTVSLAYTPRLFRAGAAISVLAALTCFAALASPWRRRTSGNHSPTTSVVNARHSRGVGGMQ